MFPGNFQETRNTTMNPAVIDWQKEYLEIKERYDTLDKMMMRLEQKLSYYQEENKRLKFELAAYQQTLIGVCQVCGDEFQQSPQGRKKKYCSHACKQEHYRTERLFKRYGSRVTI